MASRTPSSAAPFRRRAPSKRNLLPKACVGQRQLYGEGDDGAKRADDGDAEQTKKGTAAIARWLNAPRTS